MFDLLSGTIKEMMEAEIYDHLGYEKSERSENDDYRNGYKRKRINSGYVLRRLRFLRIVNPPSSPKLLKNVRKIFQILIRKSFPGIPRG